MCMYKQIPSSAGRVNFISVFTALILDEMGCPAPLSKQRSIFYPLSVSIRTMISKAERSSTGNLAGPMARLSFLIEPVLYEETCSLFVFTI